MIVAFRTGPAATAGTRVDREAGVIYGASLCQAVEARGHGVLCDMRTLQQVVELGNAQQRGLKARFSHPGMCSDGIGTSVGRWRSLRIEGDKAVGDLHLAEYASRSPQGDLRTYILDMAEEDPQALAASIAFEGRKVWVLPDGSEQEAPTDEDGAYANRPAGYDGLPSQRIESLRACDLVDEAAANRDGLFREGDLASEAWRALDRFVESRGIDPARVAEFSARWLAARGVTTWSPVRPHRQESRMGIDKKRQRELLKQFSSKPKAHAALVAYFMEEDEPTEDGAQEVIGRAEHEAAIAEKDAQIAALQADLQAAQQRIAELEGKAAEMTEKSEQDEAEKAEMAARIERLQGFARGAAPDPGAARPKAPVREVPYGAWRTGKFDPRDILAGTASVADPTN